LPSPPASSSPLLLDPPPTPIPTTPPPLHHLLVGCLLPCASKRLIVRGERRILAPQSHRRTYILSHLGPIVFPGLPGDLGQSRGGTKKRHPRGRPCNPDFQKSPITARPGRITKKAASKQRYGYRKRGGCQKRGLGNFEDSRLEIQRVRKSESEKLYRLTRSDSRSPSRFPILMVPSS